MIIEKDFNKDVTKDKRIFMSETIQQFYLISFVLEERGIKDMSDLKEEIHLINRYEIETVDQDNNKKRYIYDEEQNKVKIKDIL